MSGDKIVIVTTLVFLITDAIPLGFLQTYVLRLITWSSLFEIIGNPHVAFYPTSNHTSLLDGKNCCLLCQNISSAATFFHMIQLTNSFDKDDFLFNKRNFTYSMKTYLMQIN